MDRTRRRKLFSRRRPTRYPASDSISHPSPFYCSRWTNPPLIFSWIKYRCFGNTRPSAALLRAGRSLQTIARHFCIWLQPGSQLRVTESALWPSGPYHPTKINRARGQTFQRRLNGKRGFPYPASAMPPNPSSALAASFFTLRSPRRPASSVSLLFRERTHHRSGWRHMRAHTQAPGYGPFLGQMQLHGSSESETSETLPSRAAATLFHASRIHAMP